MRPSSATKTEIPMNMYVHWSYSQQVCLSHSVKVTFRTYAVVHTNMMEMLPSCFTVHTTCYKMLMSMWAKGDVNITVTIDATVVFTMTAKKIKCEDFPSGHKTRTAKEMWDVEVGGENQWNLRPKKQWTVHSEEQLLHRLCVYPYWGKSAEDKQFYVTYQGIVCGLQQEDMKITIGSFNARVGNGQQWLEGVGKRYVTTIERVHQYSVLHF